MKPAADIGREVAIKIFGPAVITGDDPDGKRMEAASRVQARQIALAADAIAAAIEQRDEEWKELRALREQCDYLVTKNRAMQAEIEELRIQLTAYENSSYENS